MPTQLRSLFSKTTAITQASFSRSALALTLLVAAVGCVGTVEDPGATGQAEDDLTDQHPMDDLLVDDFDDGLAEALQDVEVVPDESLLDDGAKDSLYGVASSDFVAESATTSAPHCTASAKVGDYCGGDKVTNASGNRLYRCSGANRAAKLVSVCAYGCKVAPAGSDDFCNPKPPPTCDATAKTGDYCGGDKVSHGSPNTLYRCSGPGHASVVHVCGSGCVVSPGSDDACKATATPEPSGACPHVASVLAWGIHPIASDRLRCAGVTSARIMQTIGNAAASAGTHAQDGVYDGHAYSAATDISVKGLNESQVRSLVARLDSLGFAAFYRNPGSNGWPASEVRHMHVVFAGAKMKSILRSQIWDFLAGRNGLASHTAYTFYQPPASVKAYVQKIFLAAN